LIDHSEAAGSEDRVGRGIDLAQRVLEAISQPVTVMGVSAQVSASIGVAVAGPESSTSSLLHDADLAMYAAKRSGRGQIRIFDPAMRQRATRHVEYRRELPFAISRNQLSVVYLAHCDLVSGEVEGWEALVRWEHPELGAVEPDDFVPIAERAGLMGEIGAWVRRRAMSEFGSRLNDLAPTGSPGTRQQFLSLNLSHSELKDAHTARAILADLKDAGLDPGVIVMEISEQVFDLHDAVMMAVVEELRSGGIRIALDDVGAGTSSVNLLHSAPVDIVKLAPAVVATAPLGETSLAKVFIALCERRSVWVVAEGVETHEQQTALIALGCRSGYGRWLAAPQGQPATDD
jgi:diguanylate cyclase